MQAVSAQALGPEVVVFTIINHSERAVTITHLGMEPIRKGAGACSFRDRARRCAATVQGGYARRDYALSAGWLVQRWRSSYRPRAR
jgi:hypothetical protein